METEHQEQCETRSICMIQRMGIYDPRVIRCDDDYFKDLPRPQVAQRLLGWTLHTGPYVVLLVKYWNVFCVLSKSKIPHVVLIWTGGLIPSPSPPSDMYILHHSPRELILVPNDTFPRSVSVNHSHKPISPKFSPLPIILVLDLNGVLVAKEYGAGDVILPSYSNNIIRSGRSLFHVRPGARGFIRWAISSCVCVIVWSSMERKTVDTLCASLFPRDYPYLFLCNEDSPEKSRENGIREIEKSSQHLWRWIHNYHPLLYKEDKNRILFCDDSIDKFNEVDQMNSLLRPRPFTLQLSCAPQIDVELAFLRTSISLWAVANGCINNN